MRSQTQDLADAVLEPTFIFMRAQTDKARLNMSGFGPYFEYREKDVGKEFVLRPSRCQYTRKCKSENEAE